jgi:hypothetical protein
MQVLQDVSHDEESVEDDDHHIPRIWKCVIFICGKLQTKYLQEQSMNYGSLAE